LNCSPVGSGVAAASPPCGFSSTLHAWGGGWEHVGFLSCVQTWSTKPALEVHCSAKKSKGCQCPIAAIAATPPAHHHHRQHSFPPKESTGILESWWYWWCGERLIPQLQPPFCPPQHVLEDRSSRPAAADHWHRSCCMGGDCVRRVMPKSSRDLWLVFSGSLQAPTNKRACASSLRLAAFAYTADLGVNQANMSCANRSSAITLTRG